MFDNTKPNVIILADITDELYLSKSLGPYKVASELRRSGFEVAVIHHLHIFEYEEIKEILTKLISSETLYVGFNSMFYMNMNNAGIDANGNIKYHQKELGAMLPHGKHLNYDLKTHIKTLNNKCKLVLGGPDAADYSYLNDYDYVVAGYADNSASNLANHLLKNTHLDNSYKSVFGFIVVSDTVARGYEFNKIEMKYSDDDCILPGEVLVTEISRGCIFSCSFCAFPLNGKKKLEHIKHEEILKQEFIDNWKRFGVTRYLFSDDTFNDSREKIEMIYRISKSLPFQLEYWAYLRLDLLAAHIDTADMLVESGLRACFFGIETMNEKTASSVGKGGSREKLISTLVYLKDKYKDKIMIHGNFIFGLPHESVESMKQTCDFLLSDKSPLDTYNVYPFSLKNITLSTDFGSDIDKNYTKYGYEIVSIEGNRVFWKNEHIDYIQAVSMAKSINQLGHTHKKLKIDGRSVLSIAGLGLDAEKFKNAFAIDINWSEIVNAKKQRSIEYREKVQKTFNLKLL